MISRKVHGYWFFYMRSPGQIRNSYACDDTPTAAAITQYRCTCEHFPYFGIRCPACSDTKVMWLADMRHLQ